jgi:intracellular septation protein
MTQLLDFVPIALFVGVFFAMDIYWATGVLMVAVSAQVLASTSRSRQTGQPRAEPDLVGSIIFGALTLVFRNETFIQWKPTIVNWLLAGIAARQLLRRPHQPAEAAARQAAHPGGRVWTRLNFGWAFGFFVAGVLNLVVAYNFSMEFWVSYKLVGGFALTFLYIVITMLYLSRQGHLDDPAKTTRTRGPRLTGVAIASAAPCRCSALLPCWSSARARRPRRRPAYISDELTVPLRTGAAVPIASAHPSGGQVLEVPESAMRTPGTRRTARDGTEGWVPEQYLVDQPIARDRLEAATREVERLTPR